MDIISIPGRDIQSGSVGVFWSLNIGALNSSAWSDMAFVRPCANDNKQIYIMVLPHIIFKSISFNSCLRYSPIPYIQWPQLLQYQEINTKTRLHLSSNRTFLPMLFAVIVFKRKCVNVLLQLIKCKLGVQVSVDSENDKVWFRQLFKDDKHEQTKRKSA